jgi:taurine dioxygenase
MMTATKTGGVLGARVEGVNVATPLSEGDLQRVKLWLAEYGVLNFPRQALDDRAISDFCRQFGELDTGLATGTEALPPVGTLTNIYGDVSPGQGWHTDLSYMKQVGYINVLYGIEVPVRDGKPLGATEFQSTRAAYDDLPDEFKNKYAHTSVTFDMEKFNRYMINEKGSKRAPMTAEQRALRPPVSHPMFVRHPVDGRMSLYANPGYAISVDGMAQDEGDELLNHLFEHQLQEKYHYAFEWSVGDFLVWDNLVTIHQAADDYLPTERRYMKRCRVKADPSVAQPE